MDESTPPFQKLCDRFRTICLDAAINLVAVAFVVVVVVVLLTLVKPQGVGFTGLIYHSVETDITARHMLTIPFLFGTGITCANPTQTSSPE